jgi:hypothetical protein
MGWIEAFGWTRWARGGACGVAVLAIFVLSGCGSASSGPTRTPSDASGGSPAPGAGHVALHLNAGSYSLPAARTTISGKVTRGAAVRVNGRLVHVRAGRWARTLALHLGGNPVAVEATMQGRPPASKSIRVTRTRSPAELEARAVAVALRAEARRRKAAEAEARKAVEAKAVEATPVCTNGTYVNSAGNTVCSPEHRSTVPEGATAECEDGTYSFSESRSGTCSSHGGVAKWL